MSHLEDKLAEFVFEELSGPDMEQARRHVAQCLECQSRVAGFQKVRQSLEQLPDLDVPRRMVFLPSDVATSRWSGFPLRWAIPAGVGAALLLAVVLAGPVQFDFHDSGMTIALGQINPELQSVAPEPVVLELQEPPPVDYEQIVARVLEDQQVWLAAELDRRISAINLANDSDIQRVRGELAYLYDWQRATLRDTYENASSIQLLAQRTEMRE